MVDGNRERETIQHKQFTYRKQNFGEFSCHKVFGLFLVWDQNVTLFFGFDGVLDVRVQRANPNSKNFIILLVLMCTTAKPSNFYLYFPFESVCCFTGLSCEFFLDTNISTSCSLGDTTPSMKSPLNALNRAISLVHSTIRNKMNC